MSQRNSYLTPLLTRRFLAETTLRGHFTPSPIAGIRVNRDHEYERQTDRKISRSANNAFIASFLL